MISWTVSSDWTIIACSNGFSARSSARFSVHKMGLLGCGIENTVALNQLVYRYLTGQLDWGLGDEYDMLGSMGSGKSSAVARMPRICEIQPATRGLP